MNKILAQLIRISNTTGKDPALVCGGGGNTSIKTDDGKFMYIKASGTALKDMNSKSGWRRLRLETVLSIIQDKSLANRPPDLRENEVVNRLLFSCDDDITTNARPSVEAHLHACLEKCVIHLHPVAVAAFVNARNGKSELEKLFRNEKFPPLWVPYRDPGFMLAKTIEKLVEGYQKQYGRKPSILFLEKHGLFTTAKTPDTALRLVNKVVKICNSKLKHPRAKIKTIGPKIISEAKLAIRNAFFQVSSQYTTVRYFYDNDIAAFLAEKNAKKLLSTTSLNPDELLYAHGPAMWLDSCDPKKIAARLTSQVEKGDMPSAAFLVKGVGLFVVGSEKIAPVIRDITAASFFVRSNAVRFGGISSLNKRQQLFISQWESEAFRKKLAAGASAGGLAGRIALVTGAGSGLGRSLAVGLAKAGVSLALADIDTKAATETKKIIEAEFAESQAIVLDCDVTSEKSVEHAFAELLENFGGLDILVNAAGIAPAGPLVNLPVREFNRAMEINLTGYFLCAKAAARIMIKQGIGGNIINISSKSGLQASKDNTAYNAAKAGQLHMTRGWAMELGEHGIRVNSVCPGNVFEGSKIWNPRYIAACAKKYGIKPEDVFDFYIDKTILKRGIKGSDVADSVVFLCSEKARTITGQILVTDSGQVMVR